MCLTLKDSIEIIFSGVVTVATVVYARLTWKLVNETKAQRLALTEPLIHLGLQPNKDFMNIIELYVENIGNGIAYNIRFHFVKDFIFKKEHNKKLSEIAFFKTGLNALSPNSRYLTYITSLLEDTKEKLANPIEIVVTYDSKTTKNKEVNFVLDFSEFEGLLYLDSVDKMSMLIKTIKELGDKIENATNKK